MKKIILLTTLVVSFSSLAQDEPPATAQAPKIHEHLIDSLVKVMDYELIFGELKKEVIEKQNLKPDIKEIAYSDIQYYEKPSIFYNVYGFESKKELEDLITEFLLYSDKEKINLIDRYKRVALINYRNYIKYECQKLTEANNERK